MEEYVSFHKVLDLLQSFQENNPRLNSFGYGNLVDFGKNVSGTTVVYPFLFIVPLSIQYDENTTTYQVTAIFADRLNESLDNEKDCVSDMSLCARDLLSQIKRGDLFGYFETTLPAQAQPFMERFNDNVAGVALDLNIQIFEDINACVQYPTPTPTNTPNQPTPSVTASPTNTPSVTPTNTMTPTNTQTPGLPSPTPTNTPSSTPVVLDPASLNALWWVDFTDASTLTINYFAMTVDNADDKIANVAFSASTTGSGPNYNATGYNGVSGDTRTNVVPLENQLGIYTGHKDGFTWFGTLEDDGVSQRGGCLVESYDGGFPLGTRVFFVRDTNTPPYTWYARVKLQSGSDLDLGFNPVLSAWTSIAVRTWTQSGTVNLEVWENGSLLTSTSSAGQALYTLSDQQFRLMFDGGIDFNTEQFFFDKKLSDAQMTSMFTYINNKY
jgi:hypothetical protein